MTGGDTKNLTAEVAEHTEVKKNKGPRPGARENWLHFQRFPKTSHAEGLYIERSLRSLLPLRLAFSLYPAENAEDAERIKYS